jgi:exonuclease III
LVHDYILQNTPYIDIIGERYSGEFHTTVQGNARIDFVYCTQPLYECITDTYVVRDDYTSINAKRDDATGFYFPSDHLPILVDFEIK